MHRRKYILYSVISKSIYIYYNKLVLPFNLSVIIYMRTRICFIIILYMRILSAVKLCFCDVKINN